MQLRIPIIDRNAIDIVICDNVSKGLIRTFAKTNSKYTNNWVEEIKENIRKKETVIS